MVLSFKIQMKQKLILLIFLIQVVFSKTILGQSNSSKYDIGAIVNESIVVSDTTNSAVTFKIPSNNNYILVYRYRWISIGKGIDIPDSIKLLEDKISASLLGGMVGNLKVICLAYDRNQDYKTWVQNMKKQNLFKPTPKYKVEYYNINGNQTSDAKCREVFTKLTLFGPDGKILRHSSSIAKFDYYLRNDKISLKGKFVTDDSGNKMPLNEAFVHVQSGNKNDTLAKSKTDKYGDFELSIPNNETDYVIQAEPKDKNTKSVLLLTQEGKEVSKLKKTPGRFEYKLLKADILELADLKEDENIGITFKQFKLSRENELFIIENIIYGLQQYNIEKESEEKLNEVLSILKQNPKIKLEIVSHTDSQGDDATNLTLSKKRAEAVAEYLIKNGASEKRITTIGKGETQLRNRCSNGVSCSDKEHGYNRRTEFNFIK